MPFYDVMKDTLVNSSSKIGAVIGQVVAPVCATVAARSAVHYVWQQAGWVGGTIVAEHTGYLAFGVMVTYGGWAGGVLGAAATQAAFKGVEYTWASYKAHQYQKEVAAVGKSGLNWTATEYDDPEDSNTPIDGADGDTGWSEVHAKNALSDNRSAGLQSKSSGFSSFFFSNFARSSQHEAEIVANLSIIM